MKRTILAVMLLASTAVFGMTPAQKWQAGVNEYVISGSAVKATNAKTAFAATAAYMHFVSAATEVGVATEVFRSAAGPGSMSVGPRYEWNGPTLRYGNLFVGGDGLVNTLGSAGTDYSAVGRVGYKYHLRASSALRVELNINRPVGANPANQGDTVTASVGYSFAAAKAPVTP